MYRDFDPKRYWESKPWCSVCGRCGSTLADGACCTQLVLPDTILERESRLLPDNPEQPRVLLDAHILEKATYEIGHELNNRPDWVTVPLQGVLQLMGASM